MSMHPPDRWLQPSLHPVYVRLLCAELRRRGFSEAEILQGTRLSWDDLHASNLFLSLEQVRRVVLRALALSDCPWLGLVVGQSTQLSAHGAPGYAAMAARDVGQVLMVMQRFVALRQRVAHFDVQTEGGLALLLRYWGLVGLADVDINVVVGRIAVASGTHALRYALAAVEAGATGDNCHFVL